MSVPITMVVYTDPADDPTIQDPDNIETILPGIFTDPSDELIRMSFHCAVGTCPSPNPRSGLR